MVIYFLKDVLSMIFDGFILGCIFDREIFFDVYIVKNYILL